ncbi:cytochrome c-551 precursor [bacterium BMS3Bbin14]|nr:cytochrome c-551 precursor [bacterium BMS3Abin13]GBE51952.1 cytochrome c-551 precursor [bacterium BMS3Bbin14]
MLNPSKKTYSSRLSVLLAGLGLVSVIVMGCTQKPVKKQAATLAPVVASTVSAEKGKKLYGNMCSECHGRNGQGVPGDAPPLRGLVGSRVKLTDGTTVMADDAYILQSIRKPGAKVVNGYSAMPDLGVGDADARTLISYINSLK